MKKQLFSLVMLLALIIVAGTSSWAQNATSEVENTSDRTYVMITGSTHTFSITQGRSGSTLQWIVYDGLNGTTVSDASDYTRVSANSTSEDFEITWAETAAGAYTIQVTETNPIAQESCSTVRRFYVTVLDFDVLVYASDEDGNLLSTAAELADCGEGNTVNYGDEGDATAGFAFSNQFGGTTNDGNLTNYTGVDGDANASHPLPPYTTRYFSIAVLWAAGINSADIPTITSLNFDFLLTNNHGLYQVNGVTPASGAGSTSVTSADITNPTTRPASLTTTTHTVIYTIPVTFNDRWFSTTYADITAYLYADECTIYDNSPTPVILGVEPTSKLVAPLTNTSATQTILLSPATSTITVD